VQWRLERRAAKQGARFGNFDILVNNAGLNLEAVTAWTGGDPGLRLFNGSLREFFDKSLK
jgi:NAD(P)-dependent dehydrogenase (short-subunit alcohol dehydrogenase family)